MTPENTLNEISDIEDLHRQAILSKQSTYIDPSTGFTVFTELAHLKRGKCCGNMCRHCPYGYSNVKGLDSTSSTNSSRAKSGDREGAGLLVRKILEGTYYDDDNSSGEQSSSQMSSTQCDKAEKATTSTNGETNLNRGTGGCAGGTLTSKNVPYTRKGDTGTSQLFTGERRDKDDVIFEAMGTVDELCSIVGTVYAELTKSDKSSNSTTHEIYGELPDQLLDIMSRLFDIGSHIARPTKPTESTKSSFPSHHTAILEQQIDTMTDRLPELTSFILPTGSSASASLHVARTVCRRAERRMIPLIRDYDRCHSNSMAYVNRLSDYLFTAARFVNYCEERDEVQYRKEGGRGGSEVSGRERVVVRLKE